MRCFSGELTQDVFKVRLQNMRVEIEKLTANEMDKTDRDAWIDYYVAQYQIDYLCIYPESVEFDLTEKAVQVYNDWCKIDPSEPTYYDVAGFRATCKVSYTGDYNLFQFIPSRHRLTTFEVDKLARPDKDGMGYFVLARELRQDEATSEGIRAYFEYEIQNFIDEVEQINKDARNFNDGLRKQVEQAVDKRIGELDKFASIRQGLNLPLNRVKDAPMAKPIALPKKKKKLTFSKPEPTSQSPSYCISDADYHHIIEIIDGCCSMMEQAPKSYIGFGEEQLRDHILSVLNTHYENATGETFRKNGKTDINIPFEKHVAYIAECKIWHGGKAFLDAIKQLFSYTTWRDTKVSVIVFNKKNKNFESVLEAVQDALDEVAIDLDRAEHSRWNCKIQNEEDERVMHVSVQVFDLSVW